MIVELTRAIGALALGVLFLIHLGEHSALNLLATSVLGGIFTLVALAELEVRRCERVTAALIKKHVGKVVAERELAMAKIDELQRRLAARKEG